MSLISWIGWGSDMTGTLTFDPLIPQLLLYGVAGLALLALILAVWRRLPGWWLRGLAGLALFVLATSVLSRDTERQKVIGWRGLGLFTLGMVVVASPNILWNLANELTTVRHLGDNANLNLRSYSLAGSIGFLAAQFATAGPVVFALMFGILRTRRGDDAGHGRAVARSAR